jgi:hypothetical protein
MSWINHKKELNEKEIEQYINSNKTFEDIESIVGDVAIRSGWHPAGYGMDDEKIIVENDKYYAVWESMSCCD